MWEVTLSQVPDIDLQPQNPENLPNTSLVDFMGPVFLKSSVLSPCEDSIWHLVGSSNICWVTGCDRGLQE